MKKIFFSVLAIAAIAACTKSEVQYDAPQEIGFAPAVKNITKAAITDGVYDTDLRLGIFANYGPAAPETVITDANKNEFSTEFLKDVVFTYNSDKSAWGGGYSWPNNGSLVFAGYSIPKTGQVGTSRDYDFEADELKINGYTQSTDPSASFDLGWFGRTERSYNNHTTGAKVDVTLSHALSWIEIYVKGEGTTVGDKPWKITSMTMNNVYNMGDAKCTGNGAGQAIWSNWSNTTDAESKKDNSIAIFSGEQTLTSSAVICETANTDVLVIPQTPTEVMTDGKLDSEKSVATLTIEYTYETPAGDSMPTQIAIVPLVVTDGWKSGYKYKYTITFSAQEILVAPTYDIWTDYDPSPGVTVQ